MERKTSTWAGLWTRFLQAAATTALETGAKRRTKAGGSFWFRVCVVYPQSSYACAGVCERQASTGKDTGSRIRATRTR